MKTSSTLLVIRSALALLPVWGTLNLASARADTPPPNIILVMPDDVGVGDYACLGNPVIRTPSVDTFSKQGVALTQFHVSPTCSPCRSSLLSGRHEFKNGVTHTILERERMSLKTFTLPQMLKSAGYTTGIFGKWHLGDEEAYRPESRGFDEVYIHGGGGIGQTYPGSCGDAPGNKYFDPAILHNGKFVNLGANFDTEIAAAKAVDVWLRENGRAAEANFDESGSFVPRVSTKSSKYRGVAWSKKSSQWKASIKVAGKMENLGYFDDEAEAARAFDTRAAELGRPTNFDLNGVEIDYSA
jgi:hypothetical protein